MTDALFEHLQKVVDRGREIRKEIKSLTEISDQCHEDTMLIRPYGPSGIFGGFELDALDAKMRLKYRAAISERIVELQEEFRRLGREIQLVDPATKRRVITPACDDEESV